MALQSIISELLNTKEAFSSSKSAYDAVNNMLGDAPVEDFSIAYSLMQALNEEVYNISTDAVSVRSISAQFKTCRVFYNVSSGDDYFI